MYNFASEFDIIQEHTGLPEDDVGALRNTRRCFCDLSLRHTTPGAPIDVPSACFVIPAGHGDDENRNQSLSTGSAFHVSTFNPCLFRGPSPDRPSISLDF